MSVPMASPSFLANLKRMMSSSNNGPAAAGDAAARHAHA